MTRKQQRRAAQYAETPPAPPADIPGAGSGMEAFSFGDPTPVLDHSEVLDCFECWLNGKWYEPPISLVGLAKSFHASVHHSSAIYFKTNILTSTFIPHKYLSRDTFKRFVLDFLTFGNGYLEKRTSLSQQPLQLKHSLAKYMRRGKDLDTYYFVSGWQQEYAFDKGSVFHLMDPDLNQEVYGVPQYLSALQSAWLNEAATLFRRKYYKNGSHAGFVFYMTDPAANVKDVDNLRQAMRDSKGPGNFRNLFMYAPNGKKDGIQILPVSDVAAKDEFFNIKGVTRDDVLAGHRVPPQLMGIMPNNTGGFGAIEPAARVFARNELVPLQSQFMALNDWLGIEVVKFEKYELLTGEGNKQ
ncbi:phage portal protein [Collimonas pratensis]|uniref:Phage portal protein, PBSX family n=1 Tax=Collimonas pratensis TaxID=279113 RepID=A0ABM5Z2T9_9BURK|nr:phage portal protein [Collimonas pratensis]AMP13371.1 phage portal protein, PBSX family [Collimonas pratensis]